MILHQIQKHLNQLRKEDKAIKNFGTDETPHSYMKEISQKRSLNQKKSKAIRKNLKY
jgi:hypothetical protein